MRRLRPVPVPGQLQYPTRFHEAIKSNPYNCIVENANIRTRIIRLGIIVSVNRAAALDNANKIDR